MSTQDAQPFAVVFGPFIWDRSFDMYAFSADNKVVAKRTYATRRQALAAAEEFERTGEVNPS